MKAARFKPQHRLIYAEPYAYCAHPHMVRLANGDWLLVFNRSQRRTFILHPPHDPLYYNLVSRSTDEGESWSTPQVVPGYDWHGVECAGLTALADGSVLLNQWRFRWYSLAQARRRFAGEASVDRNAEPMPAWPPAMAAELRTSMEIDGTADWCSQAEDLLPWVRGGGSSYVHRFEDNGLSWPLTVEIDTAPYSGGYGMRGALELADDSLLLALSDVPHYRQIFLLRSHDGGRSWSAAQPVASRTGLAFEEPAPLLLHDGRIVLVLRENNSRRLHQTVSEDNGYSWSVPRALNFDGYPAHLCQLGDGRILCSYGHRRPDYSIRAVLSDSGAGHWRAEDPLIIRGGLPNKDLGYPCSLQRRDGCIYTVYYCQDERGITGIYGSIFYL